MGSVRVAIVGVGNCATSLIQGVHYYRDADPSGTVPGLMHVMFGDYHVTDVEFVAAFDVDDKKVGKDLSEAINASENNTIKIAEVPDRSASRCSAAPPSTASASTTARPSRSPAPSRSTSSQVLKDTEADVLVSYLPVGSEEADKFYAQCAIDAGVAFVNALPVFIASDPVWAKKFEDAGVPIVGDDIKSQVGATITHRVMAKLFEDRGVALDRTYQLNVGGNMDFKNMLERERLESKKISKTQAVTSNLTGSLAGAGPTTATCTSARPTTSRGSTTASGPTSASRAARSVTSRSTWSTSSRSGTPPTRPASSSTPSAPRRSPRTAASAARSSPRRRT